jgi:ubiquinone/menaquinone biosynthesis C-methylase UbiE
VTVFHPEGPSLVELLTQAATSTVRGYDLLAEKFDHTPFRTPDAILDAVAREIGSCDAGIDLCCGTGAGLERLAALARKRVTGVDFSEGMLAVAARAVPTAELICADVLTLPDRPELKGAFDAATCFGAFGHVEEPDQPRFAAALAHVLRPGGRFVFVTPKDPPILSRAYLLSKGFNATLRLRNLLWKPEFVMYYLNFLLPRAQEVLSPAGFVLHLRDDAFEAPFDRYWLVTAERT